MLFQLRNIFPLFFQNLTIIIIIFIIVFLRLSYT